MSLEIFKNILGTFQAIGTVLSGSVATSGAILNEAATATNPTLVPNKADDNTGIGSNAGDQLSLIAAGAEALRVDTNATARNTRFLIYDVDNATLERVSVGIADSGGGGFKLLRIPN